MALREGRLTNMLFLYPLQSRTPEKVTAFRKNIFLW